MKKLFLFLLLLSISSTKLNAQKHSLSISTGPSAIYYLYDDLDKKAINFPVGFAFGLEWGRNFNAHWQFKLGIRYCLWKVPQLAGPFEWGSEFEAGGYVYDPALFHYQVTGFKQQVAVQVLPGVRWQSKGEDFHWVGTGEFGVSGFMKNNEGISTRLNPTLGLGFGAESRLRSKLFLFANPGIRFVFRDSDRRNTPRSHLLNIHAELGVRYAF